MVEVNGKSLSREQIINIMKEKNISPELQRIVLFNFNEADIGENGVGTEGAGDEVLKGFELKYFYKLMGWKFEENTNKDENNLETGNKKAVYNPEDETTLVYDYKDKTITKYDKDDKVLSITDFDGNPVDIPEDTPTKPNEQTKPQQDKKLTRDEINQKIQNLKPGESYTYSESIAADLGSIKFAENNIVTWIRNQDGTFTKRTVDPYHINRRPVMMQTVYKDDMKTKISERKVTAAGQELGVQSEVSYDSEGNPATVTTPLDKVGKITGSRTKEGIVSLVLRQSKFSSQEILDKDGNVIISCVNGEYKNAKGKTISYDKVYDILEKVFKNGTIGNLIQRY